jgi:hypothetical protein
MEETAGISEIVILATYNLVKDYLVRRNDTVIRLIIEKRPNFVIGLRLEKVIGIADVAAYYRYMSETSQARQEDQIGTWGGVWKYFIHGTGCWLQHPETLETYDWDLADPAMFLLREFSGHLRWRIEKEQFDPNLKTYLDWRSSIDDADLENVFSELAKRGLMERVALSLDDEGRGDWRLFLSDSVLMHYNF